MASENEASCESDPNFAVICGFLEKFSVTCGLANIDFVDLQDMLENTQEVPQELVELHVKLMRRARKSVSSNEKWEKALIKTCHTFSSQDAWEIERFGYKKARISSKLRILKELLEMQFDYNQKFKNEINKMSAPDLRTQPLGRDRMGRSYWYQCDESCQVRVYKDDPDDETWTLVAKDRVGLVSLISQLGNGDTTKSSSEPVSNEDSNSVEVEKPTLDTGQSKSAESPQPTMPDTDNMQEEKMDIDTECTENHKNIEENKLDEISLPILPTQDVEKIVERVERVEEKVVEKVEEKVVEKVKEKVLECVKEKVVENVKQKVVENVNEKVVEKIEEKVVEKVEEKVVEKVEEKVVENVKEKVIEKTAETQNKIEEKNDTVEVNLPHSSKEEISSKEENIVVNEKEDIIPMNDQYTVKNDAKKIENITAKLPINEPCENALNLCSKDLSNRHEDNEEKTGLDLSVKTGPCLRIKPITELMAEPQHSDIQKKEFMGIKGKYIRGDAMDKGLLYPNPAHLGKAVQSASYDAICYKRAMEDDIYSVPTSMKHPRFDKRGCSIRPTLLLNKKYIPYMNNDVDDDDDDDLDEDDLEDEIEEPLMLVQGEGSGYPNESANSNIEESPIIGEEIEEPVLYVFAEGNGKDCETGNEYLKESQENKEKDTSDHPDTLMKNQVSSSNSRKLGTIIDTKNDKKCSRNVLRKSRWDVAENSTENTSSNETFLDNSKNDTSYEEMTDSSNSPSSENVSSPSRQTFFFGNRSSFSPISSPIKSASLSFGASTVNDNQNTDKASISSKEEDHHEVESSTGTFNLDNKTDQKLVGSNPSQTKVPEENVDIEKIDNNKNVSERLSVIENEKRNVSEGSEHERVCDKSTAAINVSESNFSEIKQDSGENSVNVSVVGDNTKEFVTLKDATESDSVKTCVSDSVSVTCGDNTTTSTQGGSSNDSVDRKNQKDAERNQNQTAPVILKEDDLSSLGKREDTVSASTSDESSKSSLQVLELVGKSRAIEVDERVTSTVSEVESTNTHEKSEASESCNDTDEPKASDDLIDLPDSCVKDHEITTKELKSKSSQSEIEGEMKEQENKSKTEDDERNEDHIPSSTTDTSVNKDPTPGSKESEDMNKKIDESTKSSVTGVKPSHDRETARDNDKSETGCSNQNSIESKSDFLDEENSLKKVKSTNDIHVETSKSAQQNEIAKNESKEETDEGKKANEEVDITNSTKPKDEVSTSNLKENEIDNHKSPSEDNLQIEVKKSPENVITKQNNIGTKSKEAVSKSNAPGDISSKKEGNSCKINSKKKEDVTKKHQKTTEVGNKETIEKLKSNNSHSDKKINSTKTRAKSKELNDEQKSDADKKDNNTADTNFSRANEQSQAQKTAEKSRSEPKKSVDDEKKSKNRPSEQRQRINKLPDNLDPVVVLLDINSTVNIIENEDDNIQSKSGIDAIKAIKITSVQAKYDMPDKVFLNKDKSIKPPFSAAAEKGQFRGKTPEPQPLRFLRGRRPNQMLSVKSYATRNKNLVLRKEIKPQPIQPIVVKNNSKPPKELPNNIDEHLAIAKIEEHVENNVRRSTRRKPGDLIQKPVVPQIQAVAIDVSKKAKGRQRKLGPAPQEIKHFEEVDVRHSKRLRLSNNRMPASTDVETIDLTSESDNKHSFKKTPVAKKYDEVHLKGGISIKPIYKEPVKEERKSGKKNGPFLTCVNIKKLKENPLEHADSPLSVESSGGGDNSDVVIIEDDPLAVPDPYETSNAKPMTLSSFKLDVDYPSPPQTIMTRSLRKRGITEPEIVIPTGGKRRKTKGKRQIDLELRRSIEEQKKQEVSSSDEEKKVVSPKRKPQLHKPKKQETPIQTPKKEEIPSQPPEDEALHQTPKTEEAPKVKKPRASKKKTLLGLDIPSALEDIDIGEGNIRQSRRIAQLKIKEEAERRKIEDITMTDGKEVKKKSKKNIDKDYKAEKRKRTKPLTEEDTIIDVPVVEVEEKKKKRKRKRKHKDPRKIFDESNPWRSSSDSSSSNDEIEEEEDEIVEYSEAESPLFKSDHEFSPESDIEDTSEPQPLKRARTARKEDDVEDDVDEHACQKCGKSDHPEWILLCDSCDNGWHCSCLRPALFIIPEGDWFCPPCQHNSLVKQLEEKLVEYEKKLAKREIEVRRKERLAYVGISLANVLPVKDMDEKRRKKSGRDSYEDDASVSEESYSSSESSSASDSDEPIYQLRQRRQAHSYRFNDYDDLINSAIQDEMEAVKGAGNQGRGKDISTIVNAKKAEQEENKRQELEPLPPVVPVENKDLPSAIVRPEHNESEEEKIRPVKKLFGRKKHRKLNSLDVSSGGDDPDSDEDFKGSSSEEEEDDYEDLGSDSSEAYGRRRRGMPVRRSTRARTSRYDKDFINDDTDDEIPRKKKSRAAWEDSETEESDKSWGRTTRRKPKRHPAPRKKRSKKSKKHFDDSDDDRSHKKKRRIKYGGLNDDDDDEEFGGRRTRGKKINYADVLASDSDEEIKRKAPLRIESDDDYVANDDQEEHDDDEEFEKEENVEKKVDEKDDEIEKEKSPEREKSLPKESETIPEPQTTDAVTEEPVPEKVDSDPPQENFDLDNLNSSIDDLPDDLPDDNDEDDSELNPIEEINKNLEEMDEAEMEKLMEEEEYANKQLQLMAMQLEKEKKRKEREAKKKEMASAGLSTKLTKKRGRKNKLEDVTSGSNVAPIATLQIGPDMQTNPELSEPPGVSIPIFSEIPPSVDGSPKKRRGRGKGKKTLEKEQAAAAAAAMVVSSSSVPPSSISSEASDDQSHIPTTLDAVGTVNNTDLSLASAAAMHGAKLAIAAPPQPFSQTQPTPSVITRMMQPQPGQDSYPPIGMGHNYYADQPPPHAENSPTPPVSSSQMSACVPLPGNLSVNNSSQMPTLPQQQFIHGTPPRGISSTVYRQPPPNINPYHRTSPAPPIRVRNPNPTTPSIPPVYHSHHPLDPSPSGGGPISVPTSSMNTPDRSSPVSIPPSSDSPLSNKSDPTPPPPPYNRPQIRFGNVNATTPPMASSPIRQQPSLLPSQHLQQPPGPLRNNMPYHPASMPPNYYGGFMPGNIGSEESLPPTGYHYSDQFSETNSPQDLGKQYDEENSGEFGGLVSYFSSQREDDLDT